MNDRDLLPPERKDDLRRAERLEWWSIGWMASIILVVGLAMGTSQAMRTAWIEDLLSLVPPIAFLLSRHWEKKGPSARFPFGFQRVNSLAFLIAATALASFGALLLVNALKTLVMGERVTIGMVELFGLQLWAGWLMVAAMIYSIIPPVILGRKKIKVAQRLQDKALFTDAKMNKADWMTGLAGIAGVLGLGFGWWWADAAAAAFISFDVLHDGIKAMRSATAELIDGTPRALENNEVAEDAQALQEELGRRLPGAHVRLRETGRYIRVVVEGTPPPSTNSFADEVWPGPSHRRWRLAEITFRPPDQDPRERDPS